MMSQKSAKEGVMMKMHFLNVGNGDCTIIELPDNTVMIVDICSEAGKTDPIRYLRRNLANCSSLIRYVQTHPEMDHMQGLAGLVTNHTMLNFWDTKNARPKPDFSSPFTKGSVEDWDTYQRLRTSDESRYYHRSTDKISPKDGMFPYELYVLHPTEQAVKEANQAQDWNRLSYVLLLVHHNFKLLLGGDADDGSWQDIYDWASADPAAKSLLANITVFKVSHHGRRSGYCGANLLKLTSPQQIIISKGSVPGEQSAYGSYYNKVGAEELRLTSQGDIVVTYDASTNKYQINQG